MTFTSSCIKDEGKEYVVTLRKGLRWSDGEPFTADDVVFTYQYITNPTVQATSSAAYANISHVEALDDYTVKVNLKEWSNQVLPFIGRLSWAVFSPTAYEQMGADALAVNPVGTGAWKLKSFQPNQSMVLEKNPDYWDKAGGPYLDKAVFRAIPENSVRFLELKTGNIHICQFPNAADIPLAQKDPNMKLVSQPGMNIGYLSFNHTKEPWKSNVKLRKAIAHAINRKAIVDNIYQGQGQLAKNHIPPIMWGYNDQVPMIEYSLDKAKALLAEAGFPEGKGLDEITLWCMPVARPYNPEGLKVGVAMVADLAKIGVKARIVSYEWGTYLKRQREQPPDMDLFQLGWTGDNGDPDNFLAVLYDGLASNAVRTQWQNAEYHSLMEQGRQTFDQAKRTEIYKKAQQLMYDEMPVIPVAHSTQTWPMLKKVQDFKLHPTASIRLKNVWLEK